MQVGDRVEIINRESFWFGSFGIVVEVCNLIAPGKAYRVVLDGVAGAEPIFVRSSLRIAQHNILSKEEFNRIKTINNAKSR